MGTNMSDENDHLYEIPLDALAKECVGETRLFYESQYDDSIHCFELFRRAICDKNEDAYKKIREHYIPLIVKYWVAPRFEHRVEEKNDIGSDALEKLRRAFDPEKNPGKFSKFQNNIKPLMAYLKMCTNSVIVDRIRLEKRHNREVSMDDQDDWIKDPNATPEEKLVAEEKKLSFWTRIYAHLPDDKDRIVVDGLFKLGLKPREIYEKYKPSDNPQKIISFENVDEIYLIKQKIMARLRRDKEIRKLLGIMIKK